MQGNHKAGLAVPLILTFAQRVFVDGFQHAVWAGIAAFFIGMGVNYRRRRIPLIMFGITLPAVLHGLNDWSTQLASHWLWIVMEAVSLLLFIGYTMSAASIERQVRDTPLFRGESMIMGAVPAAAPPRRPSAPSTPSTASALVRGPGQPSRLRSAGDDSLAPRKHGADQPAHPCPRFPPDSRGASPPPPTRSRAPSREDGRGDSIWDTFCRQPGRDQGRPHGRRGVPITTTGGAQDVALMADLGLDRVPVLDRLAAGAARRPGTGQRGRPGLLRPADGRAARRRHHAGADACTTGTCRSRSRTQAAG